MLPRAQHPQKLSVYSDGDPFALTNQCIKELFKLDIGDQKDRLAEIALMLQEIEQYVPFLDQDIAEGCYLKMKKGASGDQTAQMAAIDLQLAECQLKTKKYKLAEANF